MRRYLHLSLAAVTGGALCAVAAQYGLKLLVDGMTAPAPADRDRVFLSLGMFLGLLAVESACWRLGGWLGSRAVITLGEDIRLDLFESVATRSWGFFNATEEAGPPDRCGRRALARPEQGTWQGQGLLTHGAGPHGCVPLGATSLVHRAQRG